jgi:hypothetical protein
VGNSGFSLPPAVMTSQSSTTSVHPIHRNHISTLQRQQMEYLSSLSYLSDWPIDIIRIVTDYMSIRLWIAFEEYASEKSTLKVLNLTSLQNEMKNNTFKYIGVPLTFNSNDNNSSRKSNENQQPLLREGASSTLSHSLNLGENDDIMTATSEWHRWTSKQSNRIGPLQTYAIIDNLLVS